MYIQGFAPSLPVHGRTTYTKNVSSKQTYSFCTTLSRRCRRPRHRVSLSCLGSRKPCRHLRPSERVERKNRRMVVVIMLKSRRRGSRSRVTDSWIALVHTLLQEETMEGTNCLPEEGTWKIWWKRRHGHCCCSSFAGVNCWLKAEWRQEVENTLNSRNKWLLGKFPASFSASPQRPRS